MSNSTGPAKPRGCVFYGCLSLAIITMVIAVFIGVGIYFAKRTLDGLITDYTATSPVPIEERIYPEPQMRELQSRLGTFQQAVQQGGGQAVDLVLSADDLNALIARNPDLKGKVFVRIEDDQIKGQVSVPLPDLGPLKLRGRYLNGAAAFKIALANGRLEARLEQVSVRDKPLPPLILNELKKQDLAREMQTDPEVVRVISRLDSLEIREGKVVIRSKPATAPPAGSPAPANEPAPTR